MVSFGLATVGIAMVPKTGVFTRKMPMFTRWNMKIACYLGSKGIQFNVTKN